MTPLFIILTQGLLWATLSSVFIYTFILLVPYAAD